jgi:glycosyltransferase involved in cell wall biosynthesis
MLRASPLVSVIMPAYNAGHFIAESIKSVLFQSISNWELVIVNDGSNDNTVKIVESFIKEDSRIKLLHQSNAKQGKARNLGIQFSEGPFVAFLDADDIWMPNHLEVLTNNIDALNADLVFSGANLFPIPNNDGNKKIGGMKIELIGHAGIESLLKKNLIPILTVLVKRSTLEKTGGFNEDPNFKNIEDYDLWLRVLWNGFTIHGLGLVTATYRMHPQSNWSSLNEQANLEKHFWFFRYLWKSGKFKRHTPVFKSHFRQLGNRLLQIYAMDKNHASFLIHWKQILMLDTNLAIHWFPFLIRFNFSRFKLGFK